MSVSTSSSADVLTQFHGRWSLRSVCDCAPAKGVTGQKKRRTCYSHVRRGLWGSGPGFHESVGPEMRGLSNWLRLSQHPCQPMISHKMHAEGDERPKWGGPQEKVDRRFVGARPPTAPSWHSFKSKWQFPRHLLYNVKPRSRGWRSVCLPATLQAYRHVQLWIFASEE